MRQSRPAAGRVLLWAVLPLAGSWLLIAASPTAASAATSSGITVKVSGHFNGTLHASWNDCQTTNAKGGETTFTGKLKGSKADEWTLTFIDPHSGKWPGHTSGDKLGTSSFVLQSNDGRSWVATKGSFTTKGSSGKADITMGPESISQVRAVGKFHVDASWTCATPPPHDHDHDDNLDIDSVQHPGHIRHICHHDHVGPQRIAGIERRRRPNGGLAYLRRSQDRRTQ